VCLMRAAAALRIALSWRSGLEALDGLGRGAEYCATYYRASRRRIPTLAHLAQPVMQKPPNELGRRLRGGR